MGRTVNAATSRSAAHRQRCARFRNRVIDRALHEPNDANIAAVASLLTPEGTAKLAEQVRRRARSLSGRDRSCADSIVRARDRLVLAVYAGDAPPGWHVGWCDGSRMPHPGGGQAAIGGLLTDRRGERIAETSQRAAAPDAVAAEIAALESLVALALDRNVTRFRAYTDCRALVRQWREHNGPQFERVRRLTLRLRRFELKLIDRRHNLSAHQLAKRALVAAAPPSNTPNIVVG